jgi:adenylate cyclase
MSLAGTILVVDDEPDVELLVTQKFRREIRNNLMQFIFARDGQEALDAIEANPHISMVMSDINMPRMDGLTLLGHLKQDHEALKTIIVSAYGDLDNIRAAMNQGAFDFVTKPIDFTDLEATIQKTLNHVQEYADLNRKKAEAEAAQAMLSRFFSPQVAAELARGGGAIELGGERREASFLFTDLAGFTGLVESVAPSLIVEILNPYLDGVAKIIFKHEGTVMKVIGDAVQAIFGAPVYQDDHRNRAVACALEIDAFAEDYRKAWNAKEVPLGITRIGINTGPAIIGNFGGDSFFDYTAYGDAVNTAARLEAANKTLGTRICVSENVAFGIEGFQGRPAGRLLLQGKSEPLLTFEPLTEAEAGRPEIDDYRAAYTSLAAGEDGSRTAFAGLMAAMPDDPLTLFHLQRSLAGARDDIIADVGK